MSLETITGIDPDTSVTLFKVGSAWALIGITSWADFASALAALYTVILLGEWLWKHAIRPLCERKGWIKPKAFLRRKDDPQGK